MDVWEEFLKQVKENAFRGRDLQVLEPGDMYHGRIMNVWYRGSISQVVFTKKGLFNILDITLSGSLITTKNEPGQKWEVRGGMARNFFPLRIDNPDKDLTVALDGTVSIKAAGLSVCEIRPTSEKLDMTTYTVVTKQIAPAASADVQPSP